MHDTKRKQYEQLARKYHIKLVFIIAERKEHGHPVNGYLKERIIYLNETLEEHTDKILGHELTHLIRDEGQEYREIQRILFEVARRRNEYNSRMECITELYKGIDTDLQEELTADLAGDYIFNEEFVNELAQDKSAFQKVYDHIKEWLKVVTSGSQEYKQIYEAKKLFEKALKNGNQQDKRGIKYSIQENADGSKYVDIDVDQDIFNGISVKEQYKVARKYILEHFRDSGLEIASENVAVNSIGAKKYTNPKSIITNEIREAKMKSSTELDSLLFISQYLNSKPDDGRHSFAIDGWDYYQTTFKVGNKMFTGIINIGVNGNVKTFYDINNIKKMNHNSSVSTSVSGDPSSEISISSEVDNSQVKYSLSVEELQNHRYVSSLNREISSIQEEIDNQQEIVNDYLSQEAYEAELDTLSDDEDFDRDSYSYEDFKRDVQFDSESYRDELNKLERLQRDLKDAQEEHDSALSNLEVIDDFAKQFDYDSMDTSRKSVSTYLKFDSAKYEEVIAQLDKMGIDYDDYYDGMDADELKDVETISLRISDHNVGKHYNEYSGEVESYSDESIQVNIDDIKNALNSKKDTRYSLGGTNSNAQVLIHY